MYPIADVNSSSSQSGGLIEFHLNACVFAWNCTGMMDPSNDRSKELQHSYLIIKENVEYRCVQPYRRDVRLRKHWSFFELARQLRMFCFRCLHSSPKQTRECTKKSFYIIVFGLATSSSSHTITKG